MAKAYIANPQNLDVDDDALFMAALSRGDIWIEEYTDEAYDRPEPYDKYDLEDVLYETTEFISQQYEEWVNCTRVSRHVHWLFKGLKNRQFLAAGKCYKSFPKLVRDFPKRFELRLDKDKQGLYWIRNITPEIINRQVLDEIHNFMVKRGNTPVNIDKVAQHIHKIFPELDLNDMGKQGKPYESIKKLVEDYPRRFVLRQDKNKQGMYWVRIPQVPPSHELEPVLAEIYDFVASQQDEWVNFRDVVRHIRHKYPQLNLDDVGHKSETYKDLWSVVMDYHEYFGVRFNDPKQSYVRIIEKEAR